jgi:predicted helicase
VGVGITLAVRCKGEKRLRYHRVPEDWRREEKLAWLSERDVSWAELRPDRGHTWLMAENKEEFAAFTPITTIFRAHSLGVGSNRDEWVYDFDRSHLLEKVKTFIKNYNYEVFRYHQESSKPTDVDAFVDNSPGFLKWTDRLKAALTSGRSLRADDSAIRRALYRPFVQRHLYFDPLLVYRRYRQHEIFPCGDSANQSIAVTNNGSEKPFMALIAAQVCDLHLVGAGCGSQCFPLYTYSPDGSNRRENITDNALEKFRAHYRNLSITKWDIFHYIYAVLHHPAYRQRFAENLKRELPRIPSAPDFAAFAAAGSELARLHVEYESLDPSPLEWIENPAIPLSYRVEDKMRLSKDKTSLAVNPSLTLAGIPPEVFEYRLGNRSALEWVIDQHRVTEDDSSGIRSDPNREDDPQYIVRLVGQVVRVSMETVRIVRSLPTIFG